MTFGILPAYGYISLFNERMTIVLGLATLLLALSTFASCRSIASLLADLGWKNIASGRVYQSFSRYHAYYWWGFLFVFVLHATVGVMHTALPLVVDPDAVVNKYVFWLGVAAFVAILAVLSSCRSLVIFVNMFRRNPRLAANGYKFFYRRHVYFWLLAILLADAHFWAGYIHVGIWPSEPMQSHSESSGSLLPSPANVQMVYDGLVLEPQNDR